MVTIHCYCLLWLSFWLSSFSDFRPCIFKMKTHSIPFIPCEFPWYDSIKILWTSHKDPPWLFHEPPRTAPPLFFPALLRSNSCSRRAMSCWLLGNRPGDGWSQGNSGISWWLVEFRRTCGAVSGRTGRTGRTGRPKNPKTKPRTSQPSYSCSQPA